MKFLPYPELVALNNCIAGREIGDMLLDARVEAYSLKATEDDKRLAREWDTRGEADACDRKFTKKDSPGEAAEGATASIARTGARPDHKSSGHSGSIGEPLTLITDAGAALPRAPSSPLASIDEYTPDPLARVAHAKGRVRADSVAGSSSSVAGFDNISHSSHKRTFLSLVAVLNTVFPDYDYSLLEPRQFDRVLSLEVPVTTVNTQLAELAAEEARSPVLPTELDAAAQSAVRTKEIAATATAASVPDRSGGSLGGTDAGSGGVIEELPQPTDPARLTHSTGHTGDGKRGRTSSIDKTAVATLPPSKGTQLQRQGSAASTLSYGPAHATVSKIVAGAGNAASGSASMDRAASSVPGGTGGTSGGGGGGAQGLERLGGWVLHRFTAVPGGYGLSFTDALWAILDDVVTLKDCEIYTCTPAWDGDPLTIGALWSFNYFFLNRQRKKLVFFWCAARSTLSSRAAVAHMGMSRMASPISPSQSLLSPSPSPQHVVAAGHEGDSELKPTPPGVRRVGHELAAAEHFLHRKSGMDAGVDSVNLSASGESTSGHKRRRHSSVATAVVNPALDEATAYDLGAQYVLDDVGDEEEGGGMRASRAAIEGAASASFDTHSSTLSSPNVALDGHAFTGTASARNLSRAAATSKRRRPSKS